MKDTPVKTNIGPEHFQVVENNLPHSKGTIFLKPLGMNVIHNPLPKKIRVEGNDDGGPTPLYEKVQ